MIKKRENLSDIFIKQRDRSIGLGNAIVDIIVNVDDKFLEKNRLKRDHIY